MHTDGRTDITRRTVALNNCFEISPKNEQRGQNRGKIKRLRRKMRHKPEKKQEIGAQKKRKSGKRGKHKRTKQKL